LELLQLVAGLILVWSILVFHEELQVKIIFLLAFIWVFGSIAGVGYRLKKGQ